MSTSFRSCQMCTAEIPADSRKCSYCGAEYHVNIRGYCASCHALQQANPDNTCMQCGKPLVDLQFDAQLTSHFIPDKPDPAPAEKMEHAAPQKSPPGPQPGRRIASLLRADENVIYRTRLHWMMLLGAIFNLIFGAVIYLFFSWVGNSPASLTGEPSLPGQTVKDIYPTGYVFFMFLALLMVVAALRVTLTFFRSEIVLTDRRFLAQYGGFVAKMYNISFGDIVTLSSNRAPLVDQGTLIIHYLPRKKTRIYNVLHPNELRYQIEKYLPATRTKPDAPPVGRVLVALLGVIIIVVGVVVIARQFLPDFSAQPASQPSPTVVASPVDTPTPAPPTPTPRPVAAIGPLPENGACVGSSRGGIVCIGPDGWVTPEGSQLSWENPTGMALCPDGRLLLLVSNGVYTYLDYEWLNYGRGNFFLSDDLTCGSDGTAWVLHINGVSSYFDGAWTDYAKETLIGESSTVEGARGIAAGPDGVVWVAFSSRLARFDGGGWQSFSQDQGLPKDYDFTDIGVDSQGRAWALYSKGVLTPDGDSWKEIPLPGSVFPRTITIDSQDRAWVGSSEGLHAYIDYSWKTYDVARGNKSGNDVRKIFVDSQDRVWIGTTWGLNVLVNNNWTTYHMHTSGLEDNNVNQIVVWGAGPELPALIEKPTGSIAGSFTLNSAPMADARVEVCMASLGLMYTGGTPCAGKPFQSTTQTDAEGHFQIDNLQTGYYSVTIRTPSGAWKVLSTSLSIGGKMVLVEPGKLNALEPLNIEE